MARIKKELIGSCIDNPFGSVEELRRIIETANPTNRRSFYRACDVPFELRQEMSTWTHDFRFYRNGTIYFYEHSRIEYFYQKPKTKGGNNGRN